MGNTGGSGGSGANLDGIMDQLEIMVENLRKECYANFLSQAHLEKIDERIDVLMSRMKEAEKQCQDNADGLETCGDHIKKHTSEIGEIHTNVDDLTAKVRSLEGRTDTHERQISEILDKL